MFSLYPNIHTSRINLDYLRKRYYNKNTLTNIERNCLIFVENNIEILRKEIKEENIEGVIRMFKMVYENGEIFPVFDEEKFHENEKREKFEQGQEAKQFEIARNLKLDGFSNEKIMKLTNITEKQLINL